MSGITTRTTTMIKQTTKTVTETSFGRDFRVTVPGPGIPVHGLGTLTESAADVHLDPPKV
jgi:hypothetical protein